MKTWKPSHAYAVNDLAEPPAILDFIYQVTTAGTSALVEPAWPTTDGATVTDGTVVWTARAATTIVWRAEALYKSAATEPVWPTTSGGTVTDGTITWTARTAAITDGKCPQSKIAFPIASKVYAPYRDVVRFTTTNNPRDWSTPDDAGFIPTGLHAPTNVEITALGEYRGRLAIWTPSHLQIWTVDPDPRESAIFDSIAGIGTIYPRAATSVSGDLFFLTPLGVRSLSIAAGSQNLQTGDIGTPVDPLVQAKLAGPDEPVGMYYPGNGQFWLAFDKEVLVYSQSRLGKVGAWSRYVFPYTIEDWTQLDGELFLRSGDTLYRIDEALTSDAGTGFEGVVWWPYLHRGNPSKEMTLETVDVEGYGQCSVSIGYNQADTTAYTTPYTLSEDTVPAGGIPIPVTAPSMAVKLTYAPGQSWELLQATLYLQD